MPTYAHLTRAHPFRHDSPSTPIPSPLPSNSTPTPKASIRYGPNHGLSCFETSTRPALIPTKPTGFRPHRPRSYYNDDVWLELYTQPKLTDAGFQPWGIRENSPHPSSLQQHVGRTLIELSPLSLHTPYRGKLSTRRHSSVTHTRARSPSFGPSNCNASLRWFPAHVRYRADGAASTPSILPASGELEAVELSQLTDWCAISGPRWIDRFSLGFPITGVLHRRTDLRIAASDRDRLSRSDIYRPSAQRFRARASRSGFNNGTALRGEAMQQRTHGRLGAHIPSTPMAAPPPSARSDITSLSTL